MRRRRRSGATSCCVVSLHFFPSPFACTKCELIRSKSADEKKNDCWNVVQTHTHTRSSNDLESFFGFVCAFNFLDIFRQSIETKQINHYWMCPRLRLVYGFAVLCRMWRSIFSRLQSLFARKRKHSWSGNANAWDDDVKVFFRLSFASPLPRSPFIWFLFHACRYAIMLPVLVRRHLVRTVFAGMEWGGVAKIIFHFCHLTLSRYFCSCSCLRATAI